MQKISTYRWVLISALGQCATFLPFRLIPTSIYSMHLKSSNVLTFWKKLILGNTIWTKKPIIVIHHPWYENYYHWTTECLPRILPSLDAAPDSYLLLPPHLNSFHLEQLNLLGIDMNKTVRIKEGKQLFSLKAIISPINDLVFGQHNPEVMGLIFDKFKASIKRADNPAKKYYLTRKNAPKRKAVNEIAVFDFLKTKGFELLVVEEKSVKEQFEIFAEAQIIIGIHGSYFVNGFCMQSGSHVIDIMEHRHNDSCYENLLVPLGIQYHYLLSEGIGPEDNFRDNDIRVDIKSLETLLQNLQVV